MIYDDNLEKEVRHYLDILNKKIRCALYKRGGNTGKDESVTEMIIISGYMTHFLEKGKCNSKSDYDHIKRLISRVKGIEKEIK